MKKRMALTVLLVALIALLCGCSKFTCDLCGQEKSGKKHEAELLDAGYISVTAVFL